MKISERILENLAKNRGVQHSLLKSLESIVVKTGFSFKVEKNWGNVGMIYIKDTSKLVAKGGFNFQSTYATIGFDVANRFQCGGMLSKNQVSADKLDYTNKNHIDKFLMDFTKFIVKLKKED